ncbi:hypothetical protein KP509_10G010000 [Ceratopteris richardii]|uniref:60S ribosomal protein L18a-like protein n=1 Tax=Ceratopteris richardii TaxID=49495 RepID=A0A8T2TYZ8_CERRI|nr:hypothetical protein KP509_10G010000 [Ceratopteris richardii]
MEKAEFDDSRGYPRPEQQQHPYLYPPQPQQPGYEVPQRPAPPYYGTFEGNPHYPQPAPPGYPTPAPPQFGRQSVPGYPIIEPRPEAELPRLPCCGLGIGWCLFISGWFLASVPWYAGAIMLMCTRPDPREKVGLICCTIAAVLSLIAAIVGGTSATR